MALTTLRRSKTRVLTALRRRGAQLRAGVMWLPRRSWSWWTKLEAAERVLYRAVVLLGAGFGLVWLPLAFIVPGVLFAAVFFGFSLRRP